MKYISKILYIIGIFFVFCAPTQAQSLARQVIASGGMSLSNAIGSLEYTVGEPLHLTLNSSTNILTQGFHQPEPNPGINVKITMFLEGAYSAGSMSTELRTANLLPLTQPYATAPWHYTGTESVAAASNIPINAVDWVLVELRSNNVGNIPFASQAGFLLSNGTVVNTQGQLGLNFNVPPGSYYLVVRHRNHIDVMSASITALPNATAYNFSTAATQALGINQQKNLGSGIFGLFAGDINGDGVITVSDYNLYVPQMSAIEVYANGDLSLDTHVTVSDFNLYLNNSSHIGSPQIRY